MQLVPGVEASWNRVGVDEDQFSNLLVMSRYADPGVSDAVSFDRLVSALIDSWDRGRGAKNPTAELLALLLENDDLLKGEDRQRLIDAAVTFITDAPNASTDDFYAMLAVVNFFDLQSFDGYNVRAERLELRTVQDLAESAAIAEWEGIYGKDDLHELREEVDSWRELLDDLGMDEPDAYLMASSAVEQAEQDAEGYEEGWSKGVFSTEKDDADIHAMFSSLADD